MHKKYRVTLTLAEHEELEKHQLQQTFGSNSTKEIPLRAMLSQERERMFESLWVTFPAACGVRPMDEHLQTAIPRRLRRGSFISDLWRNHEITSSIVDTW